MNFLARIRNPVKKKKKTKTQSLIASIITKSEANLERKRLVGQESKVECFVG